MQVLVGRRTVTLDPARALGKGGEADVYAVGPDRALKLFKGPDHPDVAGHPVLEAAARARLLEQQSKLPALPVDLPPGVVAPLDLARDPASGLVVGYTMPLVAGAEVMLRLSEPFARAAGTGVAGRATPATIVALFSALADTVAGLHRCGVVLGDFNDLNVLVTAGTRGGAAGFALVPHVIDVDSAQFGRYPCRAYTERFLDPLLADAAAARPALVQPYGPDADWYAFAVMLFRSLLLVDPYGGVHAPPRPEDRVPHAARSLRRISVFDPAVRLPSTARPFDSLPDDVLAAFRSVFAADRRGPFPLDSLRGARWVRCAGCGLEHARVACPACRAAPPVPAAPPAVIVRGAVHVRVVVRAHGIGGHLVAAALGADGRARWVVAERGQWRRETGDVVIVPPGLAGAGAPPGALLAAVVEDADTLVVGPDAAAVVPLGPPSARAPAVLAADRAGPGAVAAVAAYGRRRVWADQGTLYRAGALGPEPVGAVLRGQTRIWLGPAFGLGVSRAGRVTIGLVFDAAAGGLNDSVRLPRARGQVVGERCTLTAERAWLLIEEAAGGRLVTRCVVVRRDGAVEATAEGEAGDGSWLGAGVRAVAAAGSWLFVAGDDGLVRVEVRGGTLAVSARYPDAASFVADAAGLLAGADGLYVLAPRELRHLRLERQTGGVTGRS